MCIRDSRQGAHGRGGTLPLEDEALPQPRELLHEQEHLRCIAEIAEALKFGRESAAMLCVLEWRGQEEN